MATQIARNPFARETLMRERAQDNATCSWCGSSGRQWRYWWETDSLKVRLPFYGQTFCSVGCYRSYSN